MWRNPFLELCFVILVITVLMLQHSAAVFGPTAHGAAVTEGHSSHGYPLGFDGEFSRRLRAPANLSRAAAFFDDAWHRTMVFQEWWMDYTASAWELFNASSPAETDLLEARFHVANAEVFADAMSESDRGNEGTRPRRNIASCSADNRRRSFKPAIVDHQQRDGNRKNPRANQRRFLHRAVRNHQSGFGPFDRGRALLKNVSGLEAVRAQR